MTIWPHSAWCEKNRPSSSSNSPKAELLDVIGVVVVSRLGVDLPVRGRDHQDAIGAENPAGQREQLIVFGDVLENLVADDQVERPVGEVVEFEHRGLTKLEIVQRVVGGRMLDGLGIEFDPEHILGPFGQNGRPVSLAAAEVEYPLAFGQVSRKEVAMEVLVQDLQIIDPGDTSLPGPLEQSINMSGSV